MFRRFAPDKHPLSLNPSYAPAGLLKSHKDIRGYDLFYRKGGSKESIYNNFLREMRLSDRENHFSYPRMSTETFDLLL